ncbi:MAG TPA: hypothetical protein VNI36_10860 [Candidatus Dormibacteraeota bacterium]|nr:hypothetical protein [Candidatus Dormibacteraeota bacterium]
MNGKGLESSMARRLFLTRLGAGAGVVGAAVASSPAVLAQGSADSSWRPARHAQDEWYEKVPGVHRFVFDTTSQDGMAWALQFASNYYVANQESYGLKPSDLAVVLIARHKSTTFAYNDAMWAKYGDVFAEQAGYADPKTKQAPKVNIFLAKGESAVQPGKMDGLIKKGAQFAVCHMSSMGISGRIAKMKGVDTDTIFKEISANLIPNSRFVPAGILAVNRAQEHGYSFVYVD